MTHAARDLREELERLEAAGHLVRNAQPRSPRFEACAFAAHHPDQAVLMDAVGPGRVAMSTTATREIVAASFGAEPGGIAGRFLDALEHPLAPVQTTGDAPVRERVWEGEDVDLTALLPILTHHEHDGGAYVTAGVAFAEHQGLRNLSYHRMQVRGPRETAIVVVQRHLHRMISERHALGEDFALAVALGLDAATLLAAATSGSAAPYGFDELGIAGALHGAPVELSPGVSIPVSAPARAEVVLEGHVVAGSDVPEGPFAEFDGSYESGTAFVFRVSAVTMRHDAIYQGMVSGSTSQLNVMGLPNEAVLLRAVRAVVPTTRAVHVTLHGLRKFHAIVSLKKVCEGDGPDAIVAAFAGHRDLKLVTVVDEDVDPFDLGAVEQAVATSMQPGSDLHVVAGGRGNPVDRSVSAAGTTGRMGLDATRPVGQGVPLRALIPGSPAWERTQQPAASEASSS